MSIYQLYAGLYYLNWNFLTNQSDVLLADRFGAEETIFNHGSYFLIKKENLYISNLIQ